MNNRFAFGFRGDVQVKFKTATIAFTLRHYGIFFGPRHRWFVGVLRSSKGVTTYGSST